MPNGRVRFRDGVGNVRYGQWSDDEIEAAGRSYDPDEVEILPPTDPSKVVCVGLNYVGHVEELDREMPEKATIFLKAPNSVTSHGAEVVMPEGSDRVDHEAELGVVIGEQCRNVDVEDAMDVVAGLTCVDDVSDRTRQFTEDGDDLFRGKAFDGSLPVGPVVAPLEQVPDDATIELRVNGERRQHASIDQLVFEIDELIAEISGMMTLEAGDVISTGTPAGVAPVDDGDRVEVEIEGIGTLSHTVHEP